MLGCDDNGDSIEPDSTLDDMRAMITWDWKSEKQESIKQPKRNPMFVQGNLTINDKRERLPSVGINMRFLGKIIKKGIER